MDEQTDIVELSTNPSSNRENIVATTENGPFRVIRSRPDANFRTKRRQRQDRSSAGTNRPSVHFLFKET